MGVQDSVFAIIHESLNSKERVLNISMTGYRTRWSMMMTDCITVLI